MLYNNQHMLVATWQCMHVGGPLQSATAPARCKLLIPAFVACQTAQYPPKRPATNRILLLLPGLEAEGLGPAMEELLRLCVELQARCATAAAELLRMLSSPGAGTLPPPECAPPVTTRVRSSDHPSALQ